MSGYTDDVIVHHKPFTPVGLARKVREVLVGWRSRHGKENSFDKGPDCR